MSTRSCGVLVASTSSPLDAASSPALLSCALEAAVSYGYLDILKYLAEQGADLDRTVTVFSADMSSKEEISLLDYAKRQGSARVTAYLEVFSPASLRAAAPAGMPVSRSDASCGR